MAAIKRPAVFLAQFLRDVPPLNTLENICKWFADPGYAGVDKSPGWDLPLDAPLKSIRPRPRTPPPYGDELNVSSPGSGRKRVSGSLSRGSGDRGPAGSARWATVRSISGGSSRC